MKRLSLLMVCAFIMALSLQAQDKAKNKTFVVHEDRVSPSKVAQYEETSKQLVALLKKHNLADADYLALAMDNFRYSFVSEIENFAELDKQPLAALGELEGKETMSKLWAAFDECYDSHVNYTLVLDGKISYMPDGMVINDPDQLYRQIQYFYVTPANYKALSEVAKEYKDLAVAKGSKMPYRIYHSGFGTHENFLMVIASGENPAEFEARRMENNKMMGDEAKALFAKAMSLTLRYETVTGWVRPDLSYAADQSVANK